MDLKDSVINEGVLIIHKLQEGKHQYEVENVMNYKKASGKAFVRKGDKLMQINGVDLQDLTPEELAQSLAQSNPKLTVHKACSTKEHAQQSFPAEDTLHPFSKKSINLQFHMKMCRMEDLEEHEVRQEGDIKEDGTAEEEIFQDVHQVDGGRRVLLISMKKTSFSVVRGRGCENGSCCQGCKGTGCTLNDIVMMAESSKVVLVSRGAATFKQLMLLNTPIKHVATHHYLRGLCSHQALYASENSEKMTIYYYKSSSHQMGHFRGQPVVLNFAESNCFLRCCKEQEQVILKVETYDKERLKKISISDEGTLSFLFYMKANVTRERTFESALHSGWFIQVDRSNMVDITTKDAGTSEESFLFIIET